MSKHITIDGITYSAEEIKQRINDLDAEGSAYLAQLDAAGKQVQRLEDELSRRPDSGKVAEGWINVSERLPEQRIRVLGASDGYVREVFYGRQSSAVGDATVCWRENDPACFTEPPVRDPITHWMELPAAPAADSAATEQARETNEEFAIRHLKDPEFQEAVLNDVRAKRAERADSQPIERSDSAAEPVETADDIPGLVTLMAKWKDAQGESAGEIYSQIIQLIDHHHAAAPASADVGELLRALCESFKWRTDGDVAKLVDRIAHHIRDLQASTKARDTLLKAADAEIEAMERERDEARTALQASSAALPADDTMREYLASVFDAEPNEIYRGSQVAGMIRAGKGSAALPKVDERAEFEKCYPEAAKYRDGDTYSALLWAGRWRGWQARAALSASAEKGEDHAE